MIRVISSPSSSTTGLATRIFAIVVVLCVGCGPADHDRTSVRQVMARHRWGRWPRGPCTAYGGRLTTGQRAIPWAPLRPPSRGNSVRVHDKIYIDGAWVPSDGTGSIDVINASTEEVMGSIPEGTASDVEKAATAAKRAFDTWSRTDLEERLKLVQRLAEELGARSDEIAEIIAGEVGMPLMWSKMIQAGLPAGTAATVLETAKDFPWEEKVGNSLVVREPIGVVGCITPWNYPLHQIMAKVAPALAAGCTVVLKPSEVAPLNAFVLA